MERSGRTNFSCLLDTSGVEKLREGSAAFLKSRFLLLEPKVETGNSGFLTAHLYFLPYPHGKLLSLDLHTSYPCVVSSGLYCSS